MSSQGTFLTLELGPLAVRPVNLEARNFHVVHAPTAVEVKYPGGEFGLFPQGTGLTSFPGDVTFQRLEVRNPTAATIVVELWLGGPIFNDARASIIEPDTEPVAWDDDELTAADGVTFDGIPSGKRIRRKAIVVTNLDANLFLQIRDTAGNVVATVFPQQTYTLPISKSVEVYNANGSTVACNISEIWWTL